MMHISSFKLLSVLLDKQYDLMRKDNDDRVIIIVGDTGSGKSNLLKHIFHYWQVELLGREESEDTFKFFCHTDEDWGDAIHSSKDMPYNMITHDEAVNILYSKEAITKKNRYINKMFNIIRGKKFYHIMCIPKIWRLDSEMREDRVKGLFYVFKYYNQRVASYYNSQNLGFLMKELEIMKKTYKDSKRTPDIKYCKTKPNFSFAFPEYKGWIDTYYEDKKEHNMNKAIDDMVETIKEKNQEKKPKAQKELTAQQQTAWDLYKSGADLNTIKDEMNISYSYASSIILACKKKGYSL